MIKKIFLPIVLFGVLVAAASCKKEECLDSPVCTLEPKVGPCNQSIKKYYYDQEDLKCKEFVWRGCGGVVPYHTLDSCKLECEC